MRLNFLAALAAAAAAAAAMAITVPAWADPPAGVTPSEFDAVGGGSDFTEYLLDQLSHDYNAAHPAHDASHPHLYSFDAVDPATGAAGGFIEPKLGCQQIGRPADSSTPPRAARRNASPMMPRGAPPPGARTCSGVTPTAR